MDPVAVMAQSLSRISRAKDGPLREGKVASPKGREPRRRLPRGNGESRVSADQTARCMKSRVTSLERIAAIPMP